jgi:hypothetical protein
MKLKVLLLSFKEVLKLKHRTIFFLLDTPSRATSRFITFFTSFVRTRQVTYIFTLLIPSCTETPEEAQLLIEK